MMKKFLCDEMCTELGRWLRTAGYDTVIIKTAMQDQKIFQRAVEEKRVLLTRDRYFKKLDPEGKIVVFFREEGLDKWVEQLKEEGVDWLFRPFSRCLQCNSPFEKFTSPLKSLEGVPKNIKEVWFCPTCDHLFWLGSHTERMESQLKAWQHVDA